MALPTVPTGTRTTDVPATVPAGLVHHMRSGLDDVMPLLVVGLAAFVLAYLSFRGNVSPLPGHYPIWILFSLVGVVATSGSLVAAALPGADPIGDTVTIPRAEWEELTALRKLAVPLVVSRPAPVEDVAPSTAALPMAAAPAAAAPGDPTIDTLLAELERMASEASSPEVRTAVVTPAPARPPPPEPARPAILTPAPARETRPAPGRPSTAVGAKRAAPGTRSSPSAPSLTFCRGCAKSRRAAELVGRCGDCGEAICQECVDAGTRGRGVLLCSACSDLDNAMKGKLPYDEGE